MNSWQYFCLNLEKKRRALAYKLFSTKQKDTEQVVEIY